MFLLHFPSAHAARALPGTLPGGVRTFLDRGYPASRPPGPLNEGSVARSVSSSAASGALPSSPFTDVAGVFETVTAEDPGLAIGCGVEGGAGGGCESGHEPGVRVIEFPAGLFERDFAADVECERVGRVVLFSGHLEDRRVASREANHLVRAEVVPEREVGEVVLHGPAIKRGFEHPGRGEPIEGSEECGPRLFEVVEQGLASFGHREPLTELAGSEDGPGVDDLIAAADVVVVVHVEGGVAVAGDELDAVAGLEVPDAVADQVRVLFREPADLDTAVGGLGHTHVAGKGLHAGIADSVGVFD